MARRKRLSKKRSKRNFRRNAVRVHGRNFYDPLRGGIRL